MLRCFKAHRIISFFLWIIMMDGALPCCLPAQAEHLPLKKLISTQNIKDIEKSLSDGSYRGEEGILRLRPEVGRLLGLRVYVDQDYLDSKDLFEKAEKSLEKAKAAMVTKRKESFPGELAQAILDHYLSYVSTLDQAKNTLLTYRARIHPSTDERLNEAICNRIMDRILEEGLKRTGGRLRDTLGYLYNACQGVQGEMLTAENARFINEVFSRYLLETSEENLNLYSLDRHSEFMTGQSREEWKSFMRRGDFPFVASLETAINKYHSTPFDLDPLLFIALIKRESGFDPAAISSAGAAGLTQLMPQTALDLGMKNIFMPPYFTEALSLTELERKARAQAMASLNQMNEKNRIESASKARELMQQSLEYGQQREKLSTRYRKELLLHPEDERFDPSRAIEYGFKYFFQLMREQKGDVSLALASYNAGPHRVKEYKGIPPFGETVRFRNRVLEFYGEYRRKIKDGG